VNSFTRAEGSTYSTALEVHILAGVAVQVLPTEVVAGVLGRSGTRSGDSEGAHGGEENGGGGELHFGVDVDEFGGVYKVVDCLVDWIVGTGVES
jgi:hypothetical protein